MNNKIWFKDNTWVYMYRDEFETIKSSFECNNLKKLQAKNMNMRWWQKMPDIIKHYKIVGDKVKIPMGILWNWWDRFEDRYIKQEIFREPLIATEIVDPTSFDQELRDKQTILIDNISLKTIGLWHCSTATWKTYMISKVIEKFQIKTLIVCKWLSLLKQMKKSIHKTFWITPYIIWWTPWKQKNADNRITIINIDSRDKIENIESFWLVIIDEVDAIFQWERRLEWVYWLSPYRMYWFTWTVKMNHISDEVFKIYLWPKYELLLKNYTPKIYKVLTDFVYSEWELDNPKDLYKVKNEIYFDEDRNNKIVSVIKDTLKNQNWICFCEYVEHSMLLCELIEKEWIKTFMLIWEVKDSERERIKEEMLKTKERFVLVWSVRIIWRWYDLPSLSIGYLTVTEKFNSNIEQYVWRIIRKDEWKTECSFYDFTDTSPSILANQSKSRTTTYKREFPWCKITLI